MTSFFTTSNFRADLSTLLKIRKNVYSSIEKEIYNEFIDCPIEYIRNNRDMILIEGDSIVIKLRLPDRKQRKSRKDGYRLIYLVAKDEDIVTFMSVYPKSGPAQKIDLSKEELRLLMNQFILESSSYMLKPYLPLSR